MFSKSTQLKFWTFSKEELKKYRNFANKKFIDEQKKKEQDESFYLTVEEELVIVKHYEFILKDFCKRFMPRNEILPYSVKGTAFHFYKRFFIVSSVMDFHPKEIMLTCLYLSCKICEYFVPIDAFVRHIGGDPKLLRFILVDQETELLYRIGFRLNIHTPHRAIEGLMINIKAHSALERPERLTEHINRFMSPMWNTDVCMIYSPPLIALAAVMHATSRCRENIDEYVMKTVLDNPSETTLNSIISIVREIRGTVMSLRGPPKYEDVCKIESKLAKCRNPRNNPNSDLFKRKMLEYYLDSSREKKYLFS